MNNKYVLFICGGKWQIPWIKYLKAKGHKILLVDPYPFSPGVVLADLHLACDARDVETIYKTIISQNHEIEFVTSDQTDVSTLVVAELSEKLGLLANKPDVVRIFSNKYENRKFVSNHFAGHYPKFTKALTKEDVIAFFNATDKDIIIKPVDSQSSRGIFKIDHRNIHAADAMVSEALSFSSEKYIIAEEFVEGKEITVEGLSLNNQHYVLASSSKKHFRTGIASELRYPSSVNSTLLNELYSFHNDFVQKTGLQFGITHTEYIVNKEETDFWLVEAACRGGGSLIPSHIVPWVSGVNVYDYMYRILTGQKVESPKLQENKHAILYFFEYPNGVVESVDGLDEARKIPGVLIIDLEFKAGSVLKSASDDRGRQGYTIIFADNATELSSRLQAVINTVIVKVNANEV